MKRHYQAMLETHLTEDRQMLFLMGPRQVGKTTLTQQIADRRDGSLYLNWDNQSHRRLILAGPKVVAERAGLDRLRATPPICVFDELHKFGRWKTFLKGLYDVYHDQMKILVSGSARLDVYRAGGDSLMGRYFAYRMHPLSVAELVHSIHVGDVGDVNGGMVGAAGVGADASLVRKPKPLDPAAFQVLQKHGGFPEPYLRQNLRFRNRWRRTRTAQLLKEDLRDLTRVRELGQVDVLAQLVREQAGQLTSYSAFARSIGASVDSIKRWIGTLESLYYCFSLRPWHTNVARSLRKEPKYYLWDWSQAPDVGSRSENLVASGLLKAVHAWTDRGLGDFGLYFLRDKDKREVDFVVVRDGTPWFLVEVKHSGRRSLSPQLAYFQGRVGARHAFQVALDLDYVDRDCFEHERPIVVPALTFLSQLV